MASFDAVIRTPAGQLRTHSLVAASAAEARRLAEAQGDVVLDCRPAAGKLARRGAERAGSPGGQRRLAEPATFAHELASLVGAGMPVVQALETLAASGRTAAAREVLAAAADGVRQGLRLSAALERLASAFPPLLVATVRASEQTGDLAPSLLRYAEHQQNFRALRDKVAGAAIYPALLLLLGSLVVLFLLGVVVPKFAVLIESTRHELPWSSQLLMAWGRVVAAHAGQAGAAAAAALVLAVIGGRRLAAQGAQARWLQRLPLVGTLVREFQRAQMFRTAAMLVQGGTPLPTALALCLSLLAADDRRRLEACRRLLHEGRALTAAFGESGLADATATGMLSVAERTGALGVILERIAALKEARLERAVAWTSRLVEPALMIFIGLVIGAIVVLMYLPIFDLAASLQ